MHTDSTLECLDQLTVKLGHAIRRFSKVTCQAFVTRELPRETAARARQQAKKANDKGASNSKITTSPKLKHFNMSTPKLHFLGDYVSTIKYFGTTDSYSTQTVSPLSSHFCIVVTYTQN
jgi:hypothetical protein